MFPLGSPKASVLAGSSPNFTRFPSLAAYPKAALVRRETGWMNAYRLGVPMARCHLLLRQDPSSLWSGSLGMSPVAAPTLLSPCSSYFSFNSSGLALLHVWHCESCGRLPSAKFPLNKYPVCWLSVCFHPLFGQEVLHFLQITDFTWKGVLFHHSSIPAWQTTVPAVEVQFETLSSWAVWRSETHSPRYSAECILLLQWLVPDFHEVELMFHCHLQSSTSANRVSVTIGIWGLWSVSQLHLVALTFCVSSH